MLYQMVRELRVAPWAPPSAGTCRRREQAWALEPLCSPCSGAWRTWAFGGPCSVTVTKDREHDSPAPSSRLGQPGLHPPQDLASLGITPRSAPAPLYPLALPPPVSPRSVSINYHLYVCPHLRVRFQGAQSETLTPTSIGPNTEMHRKGHISEEVHCRRVLGNDLSAQEERPHRQALLFPNVYF